MTLIRMGLFSLMFVLLPATTITAQLTLISEYFEDDPLDGDPLITGPNIVRTWWPNNFTGVNVPGHLRPAANF